MVEISIKDPVSDKDFDETELELDDPLAIYLQQLKMVLSNETPVMGATDMMVDLESLVFELNLDAASIKNKIFTTIVKYCTMANIFKTTVNVKFFNGSQRDICLVDINVNGKVNFKMLIK